MIDEPEKHLHPHACVDVLRRVRAVLGEHGQLWIATHCPAVVAHFGSESLYYVRDSRIEYAAGCVTDVMDGLLGGPEGREQFAAFLSDSEQLAFLKLAAESLLDPGVAEAKAEDKQQKLVADVLSQTRVDGRPLRVLDYGAGRARFAVALGNAFGANAPQLFDYHAFNDHHHNTHRSECVRNIARVYADADQRMHETLSAFLNPNQVDVVLMCNFLHEIPPRDWAKHFRYCADVLTSSGVLLLLEDQLPPIGELPHQDGFVVLNLDEVRHLFGGVSVPTNLSADPRLTAISIPASLLRDVTQKTTQEALHRVKDRAIREIRHLRENGGSSHRVGRQHAFYALQFTNASLALEGSAA